MSANTPKILCRFGLHKWTMRELHAAGPVINGARYISMSIIERCDCGVARIAPSGGSKLTSTSLFVPAKFSNKDSGGAA